MTPFDLKAAYGSAYRITLDEAAGYPGTSRADRRWLYRIPAKYGHIYIYSSYLLGAWTGSSRIASRLAAIPGVSAYQVGDREFSATFAPGPAFAAVAAVLGARRKRQASAAAVARLAAINAGRKAPARGDLPARGGVAREGAA